MNLQKTESFLYNGHRSQKIKLFLKIWKIIKKSLVK